MTRCFRDGPAGETGTCVWCGLGPAQRESGGGLRSG